MPRPTRSPRHGGLTRGAWPEVIARRRLRTARLGDHISVQFEDERTIRRQLQEMPHIEKISGEDGSQREIATCAPLIPSGSD